MKKILLSFIGIFALLAFVALAPAPGVMAADGSTAIASQYEGDATAAHCGDGGLMLISPKLKGIWVMAPPDQANGMRSDFAAVMFEKDHGFITSGTSAHMIGGAASAYSKPRSFS